MPQLDLLLFKYENLTFIIFFFLVLYLNQYYIFPTILQNIYVRRTLINRLIINNNEDLFSLSFLNSYNNSVTENFIFLATVTELSENYIRLVTQLLDLFSMYRYIKQTSYISLFIQLRMKTIIFIKLNLS
jgi:hypothetical protein